jgi:hypothetical protein
VIYQKIILKGPVLLKEVSLHFSSFSHMRSGDDD